MPHDLHLSHERLLSLLHYDPAIGHFTYTTSRGRCAIKGERAGYLDKKGYVVINLRINGRQRAFRAHRLAWFYVHGRWPEGDIDHRELENSDNRINELREASRSQNMANTKAHKDSHTGVKGVYLDRRRAKYCARIMKDGVVHNLGAYADIELASRAYAEAAHRLFGEFARAA